MISIYFQGLSLGLAYVAPIGMQNLFVINSAMSQKLRRAIATALIDGTLMLGAFRASLPIGGDPYFITGFASASFLWFGCLAIVVHALGSKINSAVLTWLNRICGIVIIIYGIKLLCNLAQIFPM